MELIVKNPNKLVAQTSVCSVRRPLGWRMVFQTNQGLKTLLPNRINRVLPVLIVENPDIDCAENHFLLQ